MKINLDLNEDEIFILKKAIDITLDKNFKYISNIYVNDQSIDITRKENKVLCKILTSINHQIR